jgi:hypothetical protein
MAVGAKTYTKKLADEICERLTLGESLKKICRDEHIPPETTVRRWVLANIEGFSEQYAQARASGYELLAEEILEISDQPVGTTDIGGTDTGAVQKQRLQVDTRKWLLSKMLPKKFGDKLEIDQTLTIDASKRIDLLKAGIDRAE